MAVCDYCADMERFRKSLPDIPGGFVVLVPFDPDREFVDYEQARSMQANERMQRALQEAASLDQAPRAR